HHGVYFMWHSCHLGDSYVMFHPGGDFSLGPIPCQIEYIYIRDGKIKFAVHCCTPTRDGPHDSLQGFKHFSAYLYSSQYSPLLEELSIQWVRGHHASLVLSSDMELI
ncbi:hypothetical protein L208DRAFT_1300153, partial [Tricholoma matsutake]